MVNVSSEFELRKSPRRREEKKKHTFQRRNYGAFERQQEQQHSRLHYHNLEPFSGPMSKKERFSGYTRASVVQKHSSTTLFIFLGRGRFELGTRAKTHYIMIQYNFQWRLCTIKIQLGSHLKQSGVYTAII